jgi:hypothetical protein
MKSNFAEKFDRVEFEDKLLNLKAYNEILCRTQSDIEDGEYDNMPAAGCIIMRDYLEKSKNLLDEISGAFYDETPGGRTDE